MAAPMRGRHGVASCGCFFVSAFGGRSFSLPNEDLSSRQVTSQPVREDTFADVVN